VIPYRILSEKGKSLSFGRVRVHKTEPQRMTRKRVYQIYVRRGVKIRAKNRRIHSESKNQGQDWITPVMKARWMTIFFRFITWKPRS
jgi:hypothetical protein